MKNLCRFLCIIAPYVVAAGQGNEMHPAGNITVMEIVSRMAQNNRVRQQDLQGYSGLRTYHLLYTGFPGQREAEMVVEVKYLAPDQKNFTVVKQSGSGWIVNRVFKKLLETEKEAADPKSQARTALTTDNYDFELLDEEEIVGRPSYILSVSPKTRNKLLYRGRIWVDGTDFALARIEAEPASRPSFWISKMVVHHLYSKIGEFWLPIENESSTDVRLGGHATLTISYQDYNVVSKAEAPDFRSHASLLNLR